MDFIEQWFGVSPDGGSGATELLYAAVAVVLVVGFLGRRWAARRLTGGSARISK
jgi:hypothetical protein